MDKVRWYEGGMTPKKDCRMDMTEENFDRIIAMRDEVIFEMKDEIAYLKSKVNKLQQKLK
tara:strand:- start:10 stop:189 length:180 start_codon:yes stop_codon:yes gene_type:complete